MFVIGYKKIGKSVIRPQPEQKWLITNAIKIPTIL